MAENKNMNTLTNIRRYLVSELYQPGSIIKDRFVIPPKYMYIRKLIPVVLDLYNVQYSYWSTHFRSAARDHNLLHHIDSTVPRPLTGMINKTIEFDEQDAVVLTWIYVTISPYILMNLRVTSTTAMDVWALLRDFCREHDIAMQKKKRRFIHIDLNEDYYQGGDDDNNYRVDLISNLPDEVLMYMLSLTNDMKTVGRTSLLSKRWTRLWTYLMDIDLSDPVAWSTLTTTYFPQPEMDKFVNCVNRVIDANRAPYLGTFRIHFAIHCCYAAHIDNWLKFAFGKEVRNLDLNFMADTYPRIHIFNIFPNINPALVLNATLESLHLKRVSIKQPELQWVITNWLNLQCLSLHCCISIPDKAASSKHHRKLVISSLKLKHLELFCCLKGLNIDALHLSAPNLTSFICHEIKIDVEYHSVPSLVNVMLGQSYLNHLDALSRLSSQLKQLLFSWDKPYYAPGVSFPTFTNVLQLEIVYSQENVDILSATSLIEACPLLHTFKLKVMGPCQTEELSRLMCCDQLARQSEKFAPSKTQSKAIRSHQHLKVIEYSGCAGCPAATKLAFCLTWHAPMLRRFIFDTRQPQYIGKPREVCSSYYRDQMEQLRRTTELLAEQIRTRQVLPL